MLDDIAADIITDPVNAAEMVRDAWDNAWNTDRKRAAIKAVLHKVIISRQNRSSYGKVKDPLKRRELMLEAVIERTEFDGRF